MVGCKYAVEEALKTAMALNKWAHLSITILALFFSTMRVACWLIPKVQWKMSLNFAWIVVKQADSCWLLSKRRRVNTSVHNERILSARQDTQDRTGQDTGKGSCGSHLNYTKTHTHTNMHVHIRTAWHNCTHKRHGRTEGFCATCRLRLCYLSLKRNLKESQ